MRANSLVVSMAPNNRICLTATAEMMTSVADSARNLKGILFVEQDGNRVILTLDNYVFKNSSHFASIVNTLATALNKQQPSVVYKTNPVRTAAQFLAVSRVVSK